MKVLEIINYINEKLSLDIDWYMPQNAESSEIYRTFITDNRVFNRSNNTIFVYHNGDIELNNFANNWGYGRFLSIDEAVRIIKKEIVLVNFK